MTGRANAARKAFKAVFEAAQRERPGIADWIVEEEAWEAVVEVAMGWKSRESDGELMVDMAGPIEQGAEGLAAFYERCAAWGIKEGAARERQAILEHVQGYHLTYPATKLAIESFKMWLLNRG
jgi:hypothetical protein